MKLGASDFLEKSEWPHSLVPAIENAIGLAPVRLQAARSQQSAAARLALLTPRERETLDLLAAGHPNKVAGYRLGISVRTVEIHRANIMNELEARSTADVLRVLITAGEPLHLGDTGP